MEDRIICKAICGGEIGEPVTIKTLPHDRLQSTNLSDPELPGNIPYLASHRLL
ncbi:MAG: hypothetical protein IPO83_08605 [Chitinophagaceae bacterium]|nr:hypothetical protein [Chitinophagaceae bacterium]